MQPLVDIARRTGAIIMIGRHLNKSTGGQSLYRGQGSIGFIGIVRSGILAGKHPERDGVFVLAGQKYNLSKPPESLAYRIRDAAPGDETAVTGYLGVSEVAAQQMISTPEDEGERDKLTEAKEFLRGHFEWRPRVHQKDKGGGGGGRDRMAHHRTGQRPAQDSCPQGFGKRAVGVDVLRSAEGGGR